MDLRTKTGLLIDDMAEMRATVRIQLANAGLEKCDQARNIKEAIDKLSANGKDDEATKRLQQVLTAYPNYLAAYDLLAQLLGKTDKAAAQGVVERALKVSASTQRQRSLGSLALDNGDFGRAEEAFRVAVDRDRSGFFKSHDDYAGLARSYAEQDKTKEALAAAKDMGQNFPSSPTLGARQTAGKCRFLPTFRQRRRRAPGHSTPNW